MAPWDYSEHYTLMTLLAPILPARRSQSAVKVLCEYLQYEFVTLRSYGVFFLLFFPSFFSSVSHSFCSPYKSHEHAFLVHGVADVYLRKQQQQQQQQRQQQQQQQQQK